MRFLIRWADCNDQHGSLETDLSHAELAVFLVQLVMGQEEFDKIEDLRIERLHKLEIRNDQE